MCRWRSFALDSALRYEYIVMLKGESMPDLISIGRFAQITRLTIKALHIYDAIGLLRPVAVDADSGYRYYSITQLPMARRIRLLRAIDMPLDAIHAVLHAPTPEAMNALLQEHQQRIADRITKDQ